jgi:(p)ppGpp synthase/HD superfamily hydrolase
MARMTVEAAADVARRAHDRHCDKAGMPYFSTHVEDVRRRVAAAGGDEQMQIAALLHDVLEDTAVSEPDLQQQGVPEEALRSWRLLTKRDGVDTGTYLADIRAHEPARQVKLADLASNTTRPGWLASPGSSGAPLRKYVRLA